MTTPVVSLKTALPGVTHDESASPAGRTYLTKTSFVAAHFDEAGKGRIDFLPEGAMLRVIGPSSCLRDGFEVTCENRIYNVFEIDLQIRSSLIRDPIRAKGRAMATCT